MTKLKTISVSELSGAPLDWMVAVCEGATDLASDGITWGFTLNGKLKVLAKGWAPSMSYCPSTEWAKGGPIIDREKIATVPMAEGWEAQYEPTGTFTSVVTNGPTPLIAAMRCYVASKLGDSIEVPEELFK